MMMTVIREGWQNSIIEYLRRDPLRNSHLAIVGEFTFILTLPEVAQDEEGVLAPRVYFVIADPTHQRVHYASIIILHLAVVVS